MAEPAPARARPARKRPWRRWLRALHRDGGYFVVGLTLVYALSGLAVNHIGEWDPNFVQYEKSRELGHALVGSDREVAAQALAALELDGEPSEIYRLSDTELEIALADKTIHVDTETGTVFGEGQEPRFLLRVVNWLHLNRGKAAWTYVADAYAVLLLFLATSGLFMIPGRLGIRGRGGLFALLGILVPVLYVILSGGP